MQRVYTLNVLTKNTQPTNHVANWCRPLGRALLLVALAASSGCATVGYYAQAVNGHFDLMSKRQPLEQVMNSEDTDPEIRRKLELLRDARKFAVAELGLPNNNSYTTFVKTGKKNITWNVVATPEFSMSPKTWCFPVAGCVSYRGYFAEADAKSYEAELKAQGFDTQIGGASAYSTLGWFDDPLLDTMLRGSDIRLAGVLFHELAHQVLYVKDDSSFNEAFATFVEQQGAKIWLESIGRQDTIPAYDRYLERQVDFNNLLQKTRGDLVNLFREQPPSEVADIEQLRKAKLAVFDTMLENYEVMKAEQWDGFDGYDNWFAKETNNARLISVSTYLKWVPAFEVLYDESGGDFKAFYKAATEWSKLPGQDRSAKLQDYLDRANELSASHPPPDSDSALKFARSQ